MKILIPILLLASVLFVSGLYVKENFFDAAQCGSITNCDKCSSTGGCSWCLNKQVCVATNRYGFPIGRECNGNDVVNFPNNCLNVPTNQGKPQTINVSSVTPDDTILRGSNAPSWYISAATGGYVSGLKSKTAEAYRKMIASNASLNPSMISGLPVTVGTTYDTGDMSQAYYNQFGANSANLGLQTQSQYLDPEVAYQYRNPSQNQNNNQNPNFSVSTLEQNLASSLSSVISRLIAEQLRRNGLSNVQPFQDINAEKDLVKDVANAIKQ